jgi:hypothetical protein
VGLDSIFLQRVGWCAPAFVESDNWMSCSCLD